LIDEYNTEYLPERNNLILYFERKIDTRIEERFIPLMNFRILKLLNSSFDECDMINKMQFRYNQNKDKEIYTQLDSPLRLSSICQKQSSNFETH
jgi:hypothetical protein